MDTQPKDILTPDTISAPNGQMALPNATASLVLGILSLIFCLAYGILGVILGGIGYYLAQQDKKLLDIDPAAYSTQSISNSNAGRICSLIGLILGGLFIVGILLLILIIGGSILTLA